MRDIGFRIVGNLDVLSHHYRAQLWLIMPSSLWLHVHCVTLLLTFVAAMLWSECGVDEEFCTSILRSYVLEHSDSYPLQLGKLTLHNADLYRRVGNKNIKNKRLFVLVLLYISCYTTQG